MGNSQMGVSIGVIAHNEGKNIKTLLSQLSEQKPDDLLINEIIVVSSGSTDATDELVKRHMDIDDRVKLIQEKERTGKFSAINSFLNESVSDLLVLLSSDIQVNDSTIKNLCKPLDDTGVGIVGCRPKPISNETFAGKIAELQWDLHHEISKIQPKYGEAIAFRRIDDLPPTAADEECIAMRVLENHSGAYASDAIIYNKPPDNMKDLMIQRRRIHWGHLELMKMGHRPSSLNPRNIFHAIKEELRLNNIHIFFFGILLETIARTLARYDRLMGRKHHIWEVAASTK